MAACKLECYLYASSIYAIILVSVIEYIHVFMFARHV